MKDDQSDRLIYQYPQDDGGVFCGELDLVPFDTRSQPECPGCGSVMQGWAAMPGPLCPDLMECRCGVVLSLWDVEWCYPLDESALACSPSETPGEPKP